MLDEEQIARYVREGFLTIPAMVPADVVAGVLAEAVSTPAPDGGAWTPRIFDPERPEIDAALHRLLRHPSVTGPAAQLLGTPPDVYYGMLAVVPARGGTGLPWHQDNMYTPLRGGALNVFVALDVILPEMAGLWVAPGSHLRGTLPSHEKGGRWGGHREADAEPEGALALPAMAAGDACVFDRDTLHRSLVNATDRPRFAYAAQFMAAHAREATTGRRPARAVPAADLRARFGA